MTRSSESKEQITIRSIQHYIYCPHRWGLMEIDCAWKENAFVTRANIMHDRVHSPDSFSGRIGQCFTNVYVWNDEWGIYGRLDCLEKSNDGYTIIEYKPTKPETDNIRREDAFQLFAQKICAEHVLGNTIRTQVYYGDVRKRYAIDLDRERAAYEAELRSILSEMREQMIVGRIPPIRDGQNCSGCSMKDMCIPVLKKRSRNDLRAEIEKMLRGL